MKIDELRAGDLIEYRCTCGHMGDHHDGTKHNGSCSYAAAGWSCTCSRNVVDQILVNGLPIVVE